MNSLKEIPQLIYLKEFNSFSDVAERIFPVLALADASGQAWHMSGESAFLARFKNNTQFHDSNLRGMFPIPHIY
jgi:hypothetical protein